MVSYGATEQGQKIRGMQETYEDQFFIYQYDNRGNFIKKIKKTPLQSFIWWQKNLAYDSKRNRILPLSDFEKKMGIRIMREEIWYKGHQYTSEGFKSLVEELPPISDELWNLGFREKYDPADLQIRSYPDTPKHVGQGNFDWRTYLSEKAEKQNLIPVSIDNLEFKKKDPYCIEHNVHGTNCEQVLKKKHVMMN